MGEAGREIKELRSQVEGLRRQVDGLIVASRHIQNVLLSDSEAIAGLRDVHKELRETLRGLTLIVGRLPDVIDRAAGLLGDQREAILHLADRLDKLDGGGRPDLGEFDLGEFGGRFFGPN